MIHQIEFTWLRRISAATLRAQITSREGEPLDAARIEEDVRALDRLGWFESVRVAVEEIPVLLADARPAPEQARSLRLEPALRLIFVLEERPYLAGVDFHGSRVLARERIHAVLAEKRITLKLAAPANRTDIWHAARAIEAALADLGHPQARVRVRLEEVPTAAVRAVFEIEDGPEVSAGHVEFVGNRAFSDGKLRRQMRRVTPHARFAGLRGKAIYTPERLAEDLERLAEFYRNHGYPEARLGQPIAEVREVRARRWFPFPRRRTATRFQISIPVEEGRFYRLGTVEATREAGDADFGRDALTSAGAGAALRLLKQNEPYSQQKLERAREALARVREFRAAKGSSTAPEVEMHPQFDPDACIVRVSFRVREAQPHIVRRLEFLGQRRFSDRYYRRRILLKEGEPFDAAKLEAGLALLARGGFIRPVKRADIRVRFDEAERTADVAIRVTEIGRQRFSLAGGHSGFGNTLGIVYNIFDLFGGEELLTGHFEGGPESLQVLLGVAKEGVFGTRASFGLSLFNHVVRPRLPAGSWRERLFTVRSYGLGAGWSVPVTPRDTLAVNYQLSRTRLGGQFKLGLPPAVAGQVNDSLRASSSSRSLGLGFSRETGRERLDATASVSGGWLGGDENLLRSSLEYARIQADPLGLGQQQRRNAWAFRGYVASVSSYRGTLPLHARFFAGDQLVRGFRAGELAPYAVVRTDNADGTSTYRVQSPGADLVGAVNTEYRVPLDARTEAAAFFDAGSGWLLPGWLGANRPALLRGTNGVLRASTGVELRWRVPVVDQTVRVHCALNPLRLARELALPDGSRFRPPDRRASLGWALGSLF